MKILRVDYILYMNTWLYSPILSIYLLYLFRFLENFVTLDLVNFRDLVNFSPLPKKFTKSRFTCTSTVVLQCMYVKCTLAPIKIRTVVKSSAIFARLLKNQLLYRNVIYLIWKPWYSAFMSQKAKGFGFQIKLPHALKWNSITFTKMTVVFLFVDYTPCPSGS